MVPVLRPRNVNFEEIEIEYIIHNHGASIYYTDDLDTDSDDGGDGGDVEPENSASK